jgi:POT family proton-dependent oligopeptide transporter
MHVGLALIAIGSGGIKPCVSANVGDQFGKNNWFRVRAVFQMFYFIINLGSAFATLTIPWIRVHVGTSVAFGIPGILMFIATIFFWAGRNKYVHISPNPGGKLGLLDTVSSTFLFMAFGHLLFSASQPIWVILLLTIAFLTAGLALFVIRQKIKQDDGFLAVMLWNIYDKIIGTKKKLSSKDDLSLEDTLGIRTRNFWKRSCEKFGLGATEGPIAVLKLISVFFLVSLFWALFDQHSSSWIRQAQQMYLPLLPWDETQKLLPSQTPALNPILVMILIPLMNLVYKGAEKSGISMPPLRRMTIGMFLTAISFVTLAFIQEQILVEGNGVVHVLWQLVPYVIITSAEVLVSITGLEFAYTQAPKRMKSTIMGFWLLTVTLGNVIVSFLARLGELPLNEFFWLFALLMGLAALLFGIRAKFYRQYDYTQ